eukprot:96931-Pyramimonas_sp.AAC.1
MNASVMRLALVQWVRQPRHLEVGVTSWYLHSVRLTKSRRHESCGSPSPLAAGGTAPIVYSNWASPRGEARSPRSRGIAPRERLMRTRDDPEVAKVG